MKKKVLITAGGTGGHLFPAQVLAKQLAHSDHECEVMFVGSGLKESSFFNSKKFSFREVPSGSLSLKRPFSALRSCQRIIQGVIESWRVLREFRADVVVGFGSYHTLPSLIAAKMSGSPVVLHEGNSIPGRVNAFFSRFARLTTISFPGAQERLKGRVLRVAFPLREGYSPGFTSIQEARKHFVLQPNCFTFLVFGGSQGALSLNTQFCSAIMELVDKTSHFQVLHITGNSHVTEELQSFYRDLKVTACVRDFEERMDLAWIASDLAIVRAGAGTIAEMIEMETPAVLLPFPYATDRHQHYNAEFVTRQVQGGVLFDESTQASESLAQVISRLVSEDRKELKRLHSQLINYKSKNRTRDLYSVVCEMAGMKLR